MYLNFRKYDQRNNFNKTWHEEYTSRKQLNLFSKYFGALKKGTQMVSVAVEYQRWPWFNPTKTNIVFNAVIHTAWIITKVLRVRLQNIQQKVVYKSYAFIILLAALLSSTFLHFHKLITRFRGILRQMHLAQSICSFIASTADEACFFYKKKRNEIKVWFKASSIDCLFKSVLLIASLVSLFHSNFRFFFLDSFIATFVPIWSRRLVVCSRIDTQWYFPFPAKTYKTIKNYNKWTNKERKCIINFHDRERNINVTINGTI